MRFTAILRIELYTTEQENLELAEQQAREKLERISREIPNSYIESLDEHNQLLRGNV